MVKAQHKLREILDVSARFFDGEAHYVAKFLEERPKLTHKRLVLRGIEGILTDEGVSQELIKKVKDLV